MQIPSLIIHWPVSSSAAFVLLSLTKCGRRWSMMFFLVIALCGCRSDRPVEEAGLRLQQYQQQFPGRTADTLSALSNLEQRMDSLQSLQHLLVKIDTHALTAGGKEQRQFLLHQLQQEWKAWEPYRTDPSRYNLGGILKKELVSPTEDRIAGLTAVLDQAETYYREAQNNLEVVDISLYRLAAQKQYLTLEFLRGEWEDSLKQWSLSEEQKSLLREKVDLTRLVVKDYLAFCESNFLNQRDSIYQGEHPARTAE